MTNQSEAAWLNQEDVPVPDDIPQPILWRIVVMPVQPKKMSTGGIALPDEVQTNQSHLNYVGKIVALGALAYKSKNFDGETNMPKVGEYVVYGRYAGQPMLFKGVRLLIINDDETLAIVKDPASLRIYV